VRERDALPEGTTDPSQSRVEFSVATIAPDDALARDFREGLPDTYSRRVPAQARESA